MARKGGQATLFVQFGRKKSLNISCCQIKKERGKVQNMSCAQNTIRNGGLPALRYEPLTLHIYIASIAHTAYTVSAFKQEGYLWTDRT